MQFNACVRAVVQALGDMLIYHGELELIRLNRALYLRILQTRLDHFSLIGLEDKSLFLEIVDIAFVDTFAVHEAKLEKDVSRNA
jgi:hypothetical protein